MAVRNLARTVIEVGRTTASKWGLKQLRRLDRRKARNYCRSALLDDLEELGSAPLRGRRDYSFSQEDKLGPAKRWLDSKVGQKWDDVYSELTEKFRGGGIALSHVVDEHIMNWVNHTGDVQYRRYDEYIVDDEGILRRNPEYKLTKYRYRWSVERKHREEAVKWAGARKVIVHRGRNYWAVRVAPFAHVLVGFSAPYYRQDREFSEEDYAYWAGLSRDARVLVTYNPPSRD